MLRRSLCAEEIDRIKMYLNVTSVSKTIHCMKKGRFASIRKFVANRAIWPRMVIKTLLHVFRHRDGHIYKIPKSTYSYAYRMRPLLSTCCHALDSIECNRNCDVCRVNLRLGRKSVCPCVCLLFVRSFGLCMIGTMCRFILVIYSC